MIKDLIKESLKKAAHLSNVELELTESLNYGDFSTNLALVNAKSKGLKPQDYAKDVVDKLRQDKELMKVTDRIEFAEKGFINFWLKKDYLYKNLNEILKSSLKYGSGDRKGQLWEIEHTSPNPNKAMHLGHLRNNVTGMAIANILEFSGIKVIRDAIDNNRGIAIAKLMWGYLRYAHREGKNITDINYWYDHQDQWQVPKDLGLRPDKFVDDLYVKASAEFEKDKEVEEGVRKILIDWEAEKVETRCLWEKVLEYSYQGQASTLKRLGSVWDYVWHEHEHYKQGKELILDGVKKKIFKRLKDGAIVSNLKKYSLPDMILIKSDGTALYITQDIALTKLKKDKLKADKMVWIVGPEQSLYLKQVYAICEQLGIGETKDFTHIAYGWMSIKGQGKMSSRIGNVVYIDDLLDKAKEEVTKKIDRSNFKQEEIEGLAEMIGVGAVKYSILKVGRMQDIAFDFRESLNLEGNSGPYLQYTFARAQSVIKNYAKGVTRFDYKQFRKQINKAEIEILRMLVYFEQVVTSASKNYAPNLICNYLYELARKYNSFYNNFRILQNRSKYKEVELFRVGLTKATGQVIENGLRLLGIEAPVRM